MHPFIIAQNLTYGIFLIEPVQNITFNRALLLNIGYLESIKALDWNCFVLHDVDLLPENKKNIYKCAKDFPTQMAISISKYNYL